MKNTTETITCGVLGTTLSAIGSALAIEQVQIIISIIVTVLGFVVSVLIPSCINIYNKIKKATEDGNITKEEANDIAESIKETVKVITDKGGNKDDKR